MEWNETEWRESVQEFRHFMIPLAAVLGRSERRVAATRYVEGLLIPGQRKSIEPMADRLNVDAQSLQQFVKDSPWDDEAVWRVIRREVVPSLEVIESWIVDETGWLKQGKHSVGVAHQYCGAVGKNANCQVSVEIAVSDGRVAAPIAGRLYLPEKWTGDRERCRRAGVPDEVLFQTKPELALELIRQALADGVQRAPVLGDAAYGDNADFRAGVRNLGLEFFLQVDPGKHLGWDFEVPTTLSRKLRHVQEGSPVASTLTELGRRIGSEQWNACSWTTADGETRSTRLAWMEVYLQAGLKKPGGELERLWLVIDWPEGDPEPYHYYLAHLHRDPSRARCLTLSRSRWHVEQYFQRSKDDLGLDHYEGRSWRGFHHHLVLSAMAYLFILTRYLRGKKNFWCHVGTDAAQDPPVTGEVDRLLRVLWQQI